MKSVKRTVIYFFVITMLISAMLTFTACSLSKFFKGKEDDKKPQLSISYDDSKTIYKGDKVVVKADKKNIDGALTWYMKYEDGAWEIYSNGDTEIEFNTSSSELGNYKIKAEAMEGAVESNIITIQVKAAEIIAYLTVDGEKVYNNGKTEIVGKDSATFGFVLDTHNIYESNSLKYKISIYNSDDNLIYDISEINEHFVDKEFKRLEVSDIGKKTKIKFEVTYLGKTYHTTAVVEKISDVNVATVTMVGTDDIRGVNKSEGKHYYYKISNSDNTIKIKPSTNGYFREIKYTKEFPN